MSDGDLARAAVAAALAAGATSVDVIVMDVDSSEVRVRDGQTESVRQARSRALGVRAFRGTRMGISYTNSPGQENALATARRAASLAEVSAEDPAAGLPSRDEAGVLEGDLDLCDEGLSVGDTDRWTDMARRAEAAAVADEAVTLSEGGRAGGARSQVTLANSDGFLGARARTRAFVVASVFATGDQGERQRDGWRSFAVHVADLESPEDVGRQAARRAVRRCGWRKPPSGPVPVVFSPEIARDFASTLGSALHASAVFRKSTFLADRLGEGVAASCLTLVDDATLPRRLGSRPFDGEGVRARRTVLVDEGRIVNWLADTYSARRLGTAPTGNAGRGVSGTTSVGFSNLLLAPGSRPADALVADVKDGLYLTELFGFGVNLATGSWSRGGSGIWIENGRLAHPVQEFTVAGDLPSMLTGVREVASESKWMGATAAPALLVDGLTVAAG